MSWAPGDLALCVTEEPWENLIDNTVGPGPQRGAVLVVADTASFRDMLMLQFDAWPDFFDAGGFRKIDPLSEWEHGQFEIELMADARRQREFAK